MPYSPVVLLLPTPLGGLQILHHCVLVEATRHDFVVGSMHLTAVVGMMVVQLSYSRLTRKVDVIKTRIIEL